MLTSLHEPQLLQSYYKDFLSQVNQYQNVARTGVFVKYFNINIEQSIYEQTLESTLDIYGISEVRFDIYELTPVFYIAPVSNSIMNVQDLDGQRIDGTSSVTLFTIGRPRIHDLVMFTHPIESEEIFRITGVRATTNLIHSVPHVEWFECDLDYAPLKNIENLKIENRYVYDFSKENYLLYKDYMEKIDWLNQVFDSLKNINEYYNIREDLYSYDGKVIIILNEIMLLFKKEFNNDWNRLFEGSKSPYGYRDYCDIRYSSLSEIKFDEENIKFEVYDLVKNEVVDYLIGGNPEIDKAINCCKELIAILTSRL